MHIHTCTTARDVWYATGVLQRPVEVSLNGSDRVVPPSRSLSKRSISEIVRCAVADVAMQRALGRARRSRLARDVAVRRTGPSTTLLGARDGWSCADAICERILDVVRGSSCISTVLAQSHIE